MRIERTVGLIATQREKINSAYQLRFGLKTLTTIAAILVPGIIWIQYNKGQVENIPEASQRVWSQVTQARDSINILERHKSDLTNPLPYQSNEVKSILGDNPQLYEQAPILDCLITALQSDITQMTDSPEYKTYASAQEKAMKAHNRFMYTFGAYGLAVTGAFWLSDRRAKRKRDQAISQLEAQVA